jgi:hypothetical protein
LRVGRLKSQADESFNDNKVPYPFFNGIIINVLGRLFKFFKFL